MEPGLALADRKQIGEAVKQYRIVANLRPDFAEVHNNLGNALAADGRLDAAIAEFRKALELAPQFFEVHNNYANVLAQQCRPDEALVEYRKALAYKPDSLQIRRCLERVQAAQKRLNAAVAQFEKLLDANPHDVAAHYSLGSIFVSGGRPEKALTEYRLALELKPDDLRTLNDLAWLLATCPQDHLRSGPEAIELARRAQQVSGGKDPDVLDTLAAAYAEAGQFPDALATAGKVLDLSTRQHRPLAACGDLRARIALYEAGKPFRQIAPLPINVVAMKDLESTLPPP